MTKPATEPGFDVVTGAFSFTGRHIARRLLAQERRVRTLTRRPQPPGTEDIKVDIAPLQFTDRAALVESLRGADTLYNTYWVRFRHGKVGFGNAVANTRTLLGAAAEAGVRKVVHISVSNPSMDSHLDYYAGKARTEEIVRTSGLRWAIVRPTLVFGTGDILINNIAWLLRRMPIFPIPGLGGYRVQPVAVEDVAEIATWAAEQSDNITVDAAGPDTVTYGEFVEGIAIAVGRRPRFVYMSPRLTLWAGNIVASRLRDVMLTKQELQGLMEDLLVSHEKPRGARRMDNWLLSNSDTIGRTYASELDRHWR
ncbi:MAG TPA: NAD(P)H-binding protein [Candidatus Dormibacteraeota bacterium]|nr:NAD(P)H-binding protein [Candidatus Dormibacteraeota bacterium]